MWRNGSAPGLGPGGRGFDSLHPDAYHQHMTAKLVELLTAAAAVGVIKLWRDLAIARLALADAPEPYWSEIRDTLAETRLVSRPALRIACRWYPPVAG